MQLPESSAVVRTRDGRVVVGARVLPTTCTHNSTTPRECPTCLKGIEVEMADLDENNRLIYLERLAVRDAHLPINIRLVSLNKLEILVTD